MIAFLKGTLVSKSPTEVIIDVNGVGYHANIPLSTFEKLEKQNSPVEILTYLHVREDILQLYGFATEDEREFFRLLMSVSGIGPKMAQGILSGMSTSELRSAITDGNITSLTSISGVGKKTAERIVIELRDKLSKTAAPSSTVIPSGKQLHIRNEAVNALMSLGFQKTSAEKAVATVMKEIPEQQISVEEIIKHALRSAG
ncbi:MAG: Holliday junction branch migration protein RuvA [Ignavibacteriae bacterium]|nr:Holliday junction branch migration protein RuvA [Ignavibacteriota bacterium]